MRMNYTGRTENHQARTMNYVENLHHPSLFFSYQLQYYTYSMYTLYILERLSLIAPRKYVHSGLVLKLD